MPERPRALTMPEVTVCPRPNGLPIATTKSPTSAREESAISSWVRRSAGILSNAMSVAGSAPITSASKLRSSCSVTVISSAPSITCALVITRPSRASTITPEPALRVWRRCCGWSGISKKRRKNGSSRNGFGPPPTSTLPRVAMLTTAGAVFFTIGASEGRGEPSTMAGSCACNGAATARASMAATAARGRDFMGLSISWDMTWGWRPLTGIGSFSLKHRRWRAVSPARHRRSPAAGWREVSVDLDADPPRHYPLVLRNDHLEYAVVALRVDALGVGRVGQREAPEEASGDAFDAAVAVLVLAFLGGAGPAGCRHAVLHRDFDVLAFHAGDVGMQQETVLLFPDVHGRDPVRDAAGGLVHAHPLFEQAVQVVMQGAHQPPGLVTNKAHCPPP